MKIDKKVNYSKILALSSYLFLNTIVIFTGLAAGTCLAITVDVNDFNSLEEAVGDDDISTINIKVDFIAIGQKLPVIKRDLVIYGVASRSTLYGNNAYRILTFDKDARNVTINNINFENGSNIDYTDTFGGAILAIEVTNITLNSINFSNNTIVHDGGAIHSRGTAQSKNTLTFNGRTTFSGNRSTAGNGGAIYANHSDLAFDGEVKFMNNSSFNDGGAIMISSGEKNEVNVTFNRLATFEKNSSCAGSAIYLDGNVNIRFNSGLRLIGNITEAEQSGAIEIRERETIDGRKIEGYRARVTIVQENPDYSTEFKGNKSGGDGRNAFYLHRRAELNFTVENGNIDLYDVITGDVRYDSNFVTINEGAGWFNVREGGSINSVNFRNRGNLNLASAEPSELKLQNFTNSGTARFAIFADGKNDKIRAYNITLEKGAILELVATEGEYKEGSTYDILVSRSAIVGTENINLVPLGDSNIQDIQGKFINGNKVYRIFIGKDDTAETDLVDFTEEIEEAEKRNMNNTNNSIATDQQ
ncbi:MAG: hypothetical protein LBP39_02705, partial [Rickettsiales bacterium]|nr:hypothetical protein [Rickettsiales bacterium]